MPTYNSHLHIVTWLKGILPYLSNEFGLLPPIKTLAEMKGCSIASMHKAIKKLENEGTLVSKQGYGTFLKNITAKKAPAANLDIQNFISKPSKDEQKGFYVLILPVSTFSKVQHKRIAEYLQEFCVGVFNACSRLNIKMEIKYIDSNPSKSARTFREILAFIKKNPVKGIMVASITDFIVFQSLQKTGLPCLIVDHWPNGLNLPSINPNHSAATKELVYVLASLKHKNIALIDRKDPAINPELASGFKAGLASTGIEFQPSMIFNISTGFFARQEEVAKFEKLMLSENRPTAFISYTNEIAIELVKLLNRIGLNVPRDVSIVTFCSHQVVVNDMILSGISYDWTSIGAYCVEKLLNIANTKEFIGSNENYKFAFLPGNSISFNHFRHPSPKISQ